jgi:hypothetical protein
MKEEVKPRDYAGMWVSCPAFACQGFDGGRERRQKDLQPDAVVAAYRAN